MEEEPQLVKGFYKLLTDMRLISHLLGLKQESTTVGFCCRLPGAPVEQIGQTKPL